MDIKQIGLIERIFKPNEDQAIKRSLQTPKMDQVSISSSALQRFRDGTDEQIKKIVMDAPDIRMAKVNEIREKIRNESYFNNINSEVLADKILRSPFGFRLGSQ